MDVRTIPPLPVTQRPLRMALTAFDSSEERITHEQVEMEVLMPMMLMPLEFRAENNVPAIPGRSLKWGPKMETTAISELIKSSGSPIRGLFI